MNMARGGLLDYIWDWGELKWQLYQDYHWQAPKYQSQMARTYLQLTLRQWGAGNVYLLVLSSWKVNIAENPIAVMGL